MILDLIVPTAGHRLFLTFITRKFIQCVQYLYLMLCVANLDEIFIELYFNGKYWDGQLTAVIFPG